MKIVFFVAIPLIVGIQSYDQPRPSGFRIGAKLPIRYSKGIGVGVSNLVIVKNVNVGYNNLGLQQDQVDGPVYAAGIATAAQVPASVNVDLSPGGSLGKGGSVNGTPSNNTPQAVAVVQPAVLLNPLTNRKGS